MLRKKKMDLIRNALVKRMENLLSNADNTRSEMKKAEGCLADPFDQAATECNKFVELACRDRERELMLDIKETILRIDRGLFGICDHCGRVIHEKRLLIEPMSKLCMACQEEKEIHYKRKGKQWAMKGVSYNHV